MPRSRLAATASLLLVLSLPGATRAQGAGSESALEARVWLDRGEEPVVQRGDVVRIYYRASADAYVAIFHIDTNGSVNLLHPRSPDEDHWIAGGRDYRLLFPRTPYWVVDEDPGIGYYFMVASPEPFDFSGFGYSAHDRGWELTAVGRTVYDDPYLAIDDYVASLIPDWQTAAYGLDFISYHVGQTHTYPRFLCYDCHGFRTYSVWNPYDYACASFRVVIWDDPYYYPAYRYAGTRVVFATPLRNRPRFEVVARGPGDPSTPLVRAREAPPRSLSVATFKEPSAAAPPETPRRGAVPRSQTAPSASPQTPSRPLLRYTLPRRDPSPTPERPSAAGGGGAGTDVRGVRPGADVRPVPNTARTRPSGVLTPPTTGSTQERPVLQRRPPTGTPGRPTARPGSGGTTRPPAVVRPPSTRRPSGGGEPATRGSPQPTRAIFPRPGGGASGGARPGADVRRPAGSGGTRSAPAVSRPPARPGGAAPARPSGSGPRPVVRPPRRPGGSGSARRGRGGAR